MQKRKVVKGQPSGSRSSKGKVQQERFQGPCCFYCAEGVGSETVSVLRGAPVGEAELTDGDIRPVQTPPAKGFSQEAALPQSARETGIPAETISHVRSQQAAHRATYSSITLS